MPTKKAKVFKKIKPTRKSANIPIRNIEVSHGFNPFRRRNLLKSFQAIQHNEIEPCSRKKNEPIGEYLNSEVKCEKIVNDMFRISPQLEGSFTDIFLKKDDQSQVKRPLSNSGEVPGFICQFCDRICKNKAGLLAHQRGKICKAKQ